jgi:hypothetical protein
MPEFPLWGVDETDSGYLGRLSWTRLLDAETLPAFGVTGSSGVASFTTLGQPSVHIHRPDQTVFVEQLKWLRAYNDLRADRIEEIHLQISDIMSFYGAIFLLNDSRRKATLELLYAVWRVTIGIESLAKHICRAPRPVDYSARVQPVIQTPDHSTFPSGHATEAFAIATVFNALMTGQNAHAGLAAGAMPYKAAARIGVNRTVAGVHFPVDTAAGAMLGCAVGEAFVALATGNLSAYSALDPVDFQVAAADAETPDAFLPDSDFSLRWLAQAFPDRAMFPSAHTEIPQTQLGRLWDRARSEVRSNALPAGGGGA